MFLQGKPLFKKSYEVLNGWGEDDKLIPGWAKSVRNLALSVESKLAVAIIAHYLRFEKRLIKETLV